MIEELKSLYEKQRKKGGLNKADGERASEIITELLKKDNELAYEYMMKISPEYGVEPFSIHLNTLDKETRDKKIQTFLDNQEFKENNSNMGFKRGLVLAREIFKQKLGSSRVLRVLGETCKVAIKTSKSGVNSQIIGYTYQDFIKMVDRKFFNIDVSKYSDMEEYETYMGKVFVNTVFPDADIKIAIPFKYQLLVLKWLTSFKTVYELDSNEKGKVYIYSGKWSEELRKMVLEDEDINRRYGQYIAVEKIEDKSPIEEKSKSEDKNFNDRDIFKEILNDISELEKRFTIKDKQVEKTISNLSFYKTENEKLKKEKEMLQERVDKLSKTNEIETEERYRLNMENNKLKEEIEKLKANEKINQKQVEEVFANNEIMKKSAVDGFKSKLGSSLRSYYYEFQDIEDEKVDEEMGEIMKLKVKEIFEELIRQGVRI